MAMGSGKNLNFEGRDSWAREEACGLGVHCDGKRERERENKNKNLLKIVGFGEREREGGVGNNEMGGSGVCV